MTTSQEQITAALILTAMAADPSPTALPPTFAGDPWAWASWHAHNAAATAVCDLGERSMRAPRVRRPNRRRQVPALVMLGLGAYFAARKAGTR